jgi:predicted Zn-dependent protease
MNKLVLLCLITLCLSGAFAQVSSQPNQLTKAQVIQKVCRGSEIASGPEFDIFHRAFAKLAPVIQQDPHIVYIALADNNDINAWATNFDMTHSMICVPVAMVHFMGDAEGELAFIIAHEIGHTVDDVCKTESGRLAVANSRGSLGALFGGLVGGSQGAASASKVSQQRGCEARADEIGFAIFTKAGYSPYAAAGAFGRLEMYLGDTSTGIFARLNALGSDHPMTPDRIKHMRTLLINFASQSAGGVQ